jgi:hypothetical protein
MMEMPLFTDFHVRFERSGIFLQVGRPPSMLIYIPKHDCIATNAPATPPDLIAPLAMHVGAAPLITADTLYAPDVHYTVKVTPYSLIEILRKSLLIPFDMFCS